MTGFQLGAAIPLLRNTASAWSENWRKSSELLSNNQVNTLKDGSRAGVKARRAILLPVRFFLGRTLFCLSASFKLYKSSATWRCTF